MVQLPNSSRSGPVLIFPVGGLGSASLTSKPAGHPYPVGNRYLVRSAPHDLEMTTATTAARGPTWGTAWVNLSGTRLRVAERGSGPPLLRYHSERYLRWVSPRLHGGGSRALAAGGADALRAPTLVLAGDDDPLIPLDQPEDPVAEVEAFLR